MNQAPIERVKDDEQPEEKKTLTVEDIPKIIKGNKRLPDESQEDYRERQKMEKRLMKMRLKVGTHRFKHTKEDIAKNGGKAQPFINTQKRIEKSIRKQKQAERKAKAAKRRQAKREAK